MPEDLFNQPCQHEWIIETMAFPDPVGLENIEICKKCGKEKV